MVVSALSSNFGLIGFTVSEIVRFSYFGNLALNCLFTPTFKGFWGIFFQNNNVVYHCNSKTHFLARKHVVWAIKRENRSNGSTCARARKKDRTGQSKKSQRRYISPTWGEAPSELMFYRNSHSSCRPRRNQVWKVLSWNFQWLRFYKKSNFPFPIDFCMGLTTVQRYCAACDTDDWLNVSRAQHFPCSRRGVTLRYTSSNCIVRTRMASNSFYGAKMKALHDIQKR